MAFFRKHEPRINIDDALRDTQHAIQQSNWHKALPLLKQILKQAPQCAEAYYQRSVIYLYTLAYKSAMQDAQQAVEKSPEQAKYLHHRGLVHFYLGCYDLALTDYNTAIQYSPNDWDIYLSRALATWDPEKALADINYVLQRDKNHQIAYNNRATLLMHLEKYDEALKDYEQCLRLAPRDTDAHCQVGIVLQKMKQYEASLTYFDQAIALNPQQADAYSYKGYSLYRLKRWDDARAQFKAACERDETHVEAHYNLGILLRSVHQYDEAFHYLGLAMHYQLEQEKAIEKALEVNKKRIKQRTCSVAKGTGEVLTSTGILLLEVGLSVFRGGGMAASWAVDASAPGAGLGVAAAVELVCGICELSVLIIQQVQLAKANQSQCKRLHNRIVIVCDAVMGLDTTHNTSHYILGLRHLEATLKACQNLTAKFSHQHWFKKVLLAGTHKEQFDQVFNDLNEAIQMLNLGLNAQQVMNEEDNRQDELKDKVDIQNNMEKIIKLNMALQQDLQQLALEEKERHKILLQQFNSVKLALQKALTRSSKDDKALHGLNNIPFHALSIDKQLAKSTLGQVYLGRFNDEVVAIKEIVGLTSEHAKQQFLREARIMNSVKSQYFGLFYGICYEEDRHYIVMEYFPQGNLEEYMEHTPLTVMQRYQLAIEVAESLRFLHRSEIYHRNLTKSHVLIDDYGRARLADFGLAKVSHTIADTVIKTVQSKGVTLKIMPPECLNPVCQVDPEKVDIYSFGILLWELLTNKNAYADWPDDVLISRILAGEREVIPDDFPAPIKQLINGCWHKHPAKRPTITEALTLLRAEKQVVSSYPEIPMVLTPAKVPFEQVVIEGAIANHVHVGKWCEQPVAVKQCCFNEAESRNKLQREMAFLRSLQSPHVVPFYDGGITQDKGWLVMQHMLGGDLTDWVKNKHITYIQRMHLLKQLAQGLLYIHTCQVAHGAIHPQHILLDAHNQGVWTHFSEARDLRSTVAFVGSSSLNLDLAWLAPEYRASGQCSAATDVYGFGLIMTYVLTEGLEPAIFNSDDQDTATPYSWDILAIPETYSALIQQCCDPKPSQRPTIHQVVKRLSAFSSQVDTVSTNFWQTAAMDYEQGKKCEVNHDEMAKAYYYQAALKGSIKGESALSQWYLRSKPGTPSLPSKDLIYQWLKHAAEQGEQRAMINLGYQLEKGDGVRQNKALALKWYKAAAKQGSRSAEKRYQKLQKCM